MPSEKKRGQHPQDKQLFGSKFESAFRDAVADLSWLRTRGYAENSGQKLVGDRYNLTDRQRIAVARCACGDDALERRNEHRTPVSEVRDGSLLIDGFNLLTTVEAALGGGILMRGRDGCIRDMTSMHGNYRVLSDTEAALQLIFENLKRLGPAKVVWYLDKPVSNSGRLKTILTESAKNFPEFKTEVRLVKDPDPILKRAKADSIVVSADSAILDACECWTNLADYVLAMSLPEREILDWVSVAKPEEKEPAVQQVEGVRRLTGEVEW